MKKSQPTSIRLSEYMYNQIKEEAEREKRSISAQIEYNLEKYYEIIKIAKNSAPHTKSGDAP